MSALHHAAGRRGVSLAELLVTMSCASIVVAGATALLHRTLSLETSSRRVLQRERAALALARQFRADVHLATTVRCSQDGLEDPVVMRLETAGGRSIRYETTATGIARIEQAPADATSREDWPVGDGIAWSSIRRRDLISLLGRCAPPPTALAFEAQAARGTGLAGTTGARP